MKNLCKILLQVSGSGKDVQRFKLNFSTSQQAGILLTVNVKKQISNLFQDVECNRTVIDESPTFSTRKDFPADDVFLFKIKLIGFQKQFQACRKT